MIPSNTSSFRTSTAVIAALQSSLITLRSVIGTATLRMDIFGNTILLLLLPLALQPTVGFGMSNNVLPFFSYLPQLCPSSHSHLLNISFYFLFPSFPGSFPSSRPFQFLSDDFLGILSSSILSRWPNQLILCSFIRFTIFSPLLISYRSRFVLLFHSPFSYLGPYVLLNIFLSKIGRACSSFFFNVHASAPYDTTSPISVLYNIILVALDKSRLLESLNLITLVIFGEECTSWISSLRSFLQVTYSIFNPKPTYLPQHTILKHHQPITCPQCERPSVTPIQNNVRNCNCV